MSNFIGDRFTFNNPLISKYNPATTSLTPYYNKNNNPQIGLELSPLYSTNPSWILTVLPRIRAFKIIETQMQKPYNREWVNQYKRGTNPDRTYDGRYEWLYEGDWKTQNPAQKDFNFFIGRYKPNNRVEMATSVINTRNADELNGFFGKRIVKNINGEAYGVRMNINYEWLIKGNASFLANKWRAFELYKGYNILISKDNFHLPLIYIKTKDPNVHIGIKLIDTAFNARNPYKPIFNFLNLRRQRHFYRDATEEFNGLVVPQVRMEQLEDTNHLNGMCLSKFNSRNGMNRSYTVNNIYQYTTLTMNENGVKTNSDFIAGMNKEGYAHNRLMRGNFIVDRPFIMWVEHDWIPSYPLMIGMYNRDTWIPI